VKYARINKMDWSQLHFLNTALATHKDFTILASSSEDEVFGSLSSFPKIVRNRFLIHSTTYFTRPHRRKLPANFLRHWKICGHQLLLGQYNQQSQRQMASHPLQPEYYFWKTMLSAYDARGEEVRGYCPLCPTDFSIQTHARKMTLRVWVDLGLDDSPSNILWKAQTCKNLEGSFKYEEPGWVRSLYESERGRIAPPKPEPKSALKSAENSTRRSCDALVRKMFSDELVQRMSLMAFPTQ
jgi:hypothetical protein